METTLSRIALWLGRRLDERAMSTLVRPGPDVVRTIGLALDPEDLPEEPCVDAVFLHRPFRLAGVAAGHGVLGSHDGFDARLTTGDNRALARRLGWTHLERVEWPRAVGLLAHPPSRTWEALLDSLEVEFGGVEETHAPRSNAVSRVVIVNAMRPELVRAAAERGAQAYLTGQMRRGALTAARSLGLGIVAVGHRRSEFWGLRQLAGELEEAFPGLATVVFGGPDGPLRPDRSTPGES